MKRVIVNYSKLTSEILSLLVDKYPDGYNNRDIVRFKNAKNEEVEAVEVSTDDTMYLVKISSNLEQSMEDYDVSDDDLDNDDDNDDLEIDDLEEEPSVDVDLDDD
ncbi:hypothetical protein [Urechidicola croceus]|uniref:DNA primase n=1 Tax=Urechidicola croceus TaxID=1850246 RepID=A0A1D8PAC8_9FLAO|nr:hypothetical protein [Urechidicola croceus]AOW21520.1 hypothetical protein LPB138_12895 [Urechidicola croceus]